MSGYSQGGQIVHEAANTLVDDGQQAALDKVAAGEQSTMLKANLGVLVE